MTENGASGGDRLCSRQDEITQRLQELGDNLCRGKITASEATAESALLREQFFENEHRLLSAHRDEFRAAVGS